MKRLLPLLAALLLAGCGGGGSSTQPPLEEWPGPPDAKADGTIDVSEYDDFLARGGDVFAGSPVSVVTEFLQLGATSSRSTSVVSTSPLETRDAATVVATLDGLLDDSVRAARYIVEVQKDPSGTWRLVSAKVSFRCQPGRGHQDFSVKLCL